MKSAPIALMRALSRIVLAEGALAYFVFASSRM